MISKENYGKVFNYLVKRTQDYVVSSNLNCMVLGISGGIDSTLVAAIASAVSDRTGIPLIGRSLRMKNKQDEFDTSKLVGKAFCTDFDAMNLGSEYSKVSSGFRILEENHSKSLNCSKEKYTTPIAEGNLMARLRMMYLYHIAGVEGGLVLDTDNLTEHNLGFWTLHGDEGDFNPIGGLWKTEVYGLSNWLLEKIEKGIYPDDLRVTVRVNNEIKALKESISLTPTDGNGISSSDLEQIGGKDYFEVDKILKPIVEASELGKDPEWKTYLNVRDSGLYPIETVDKIYKRFCSSKFKRVTSRTIKITRKEILDEIGKCS